MSAPQKYLTIGLWITAVIGMVGILVIKMLPPGREGSVSAGVGDSKAIIMEEPEPATAAQLPRFFAIPGFSLTNQNGQKVTNADLAGHIWIGDFIYTTCASECPQMSAHMQVLQRQLPSDVRLVSFSVDPEHDTPPVLLAYARQYQADPDRWNFLTGDLASVKDVVAKIKMMYEPATTNNPIGHDPRFFLVDASGMIRGYYDSNHSEQLDRLVRQVRLLIDARAGAAK